LNLKKQKPFFLVLFLLFAIIFYSVPSYAADYPYTYETKVFNQDEFEAEMLHYINEARQKEGLALLKKAPQLVEVARLKSHDMIKNNYFSHTSPTYGSPFDMMKQFGISYRTAGENLAGAYSVKAAHEALMNSPTHKKNILNPSFTHIGIGIVKGGPYGIMFTQMFVGQPEFQNEVDNPQPAENNSEGNNANNWIDTLTELINTEREKNGLPKLNLNKDLMRAAQMKAKDMVDKNYLSYYSPTYGYIKDMLKSLNIPFAEIRENIIGASNVKVAHETFMNSARHKNIILNPEYKELGVGVEAGGKYGLSIVEIFVEPKVSNQEPQPQPEIRERYGKSCQ